MKSETKSTPIGISDTSGTPWKALGLLTCAVMFAMSLWFSASAVVPTLMRLWHLSGPATIWLTTSVQIGFITGALVSATLGLPDLLNSRKLLVSSYFLAATFNGLFLVVGSNIAAGLLLRFLTGVTLAGVYPIAVKIVSTWFTRKRGLAVGILIAGLTIGSALPYLIRGTGAFDNWQTVIVGSSLLAQIGGFTVGYCRDRRFCAIFYCRHRTELPANSRKCGNLPTCNRLFDNSSFDQPHPVGTNNDELALGICNLELGACRRHSGYGTTATKF